LGAKRTLFRPFPMSAVDPFRKSAADFGSLSL
jgi:hypothetical protein